MGRTRRLTAGVAPRWVAPAAFAAALVAYLVAHTPFVGAGAALVAAAGGGGEVAAGPRSLAAAAWRGAWVLAAGGALAALGEGAAPAVPHRALAVLAATLAASLAAALALVTGAPWPLEPSHARLAVALLGAVAAAALALPVARRSPAHAGAVAALAVGALWWWTGAAAAGAPELRAARLRFLLGGGWAPPVRDVALAGAAALLLLAAPRRLLRGWRAPLALGGLAATAGPLPLLGAVAQGLARPGRRVAGALWGGALALGAGALLALAAPGTVLPAGLLTLACGLSYLGAVALRRRFGAPSR